jgi:hypothetical protein
MIMPIAKLKPARFDWSATPREVFGQNPRMRIIVLLRRTERDLTFFLQEWQGSDTGQKKIGGITCR